MDKPLVNRVASSGLITINLEEFYPSEEILLFDLKDYLFMELILKEKDFREALKNHDWEQYQGKYVRVFCSADAIIPMWAYMLVVSYAAQYAIQVIQGNEEESLKLIYQKKLSEIDYNQYQDKRIVIKGCSEKAVPTFAYTFLTEQLRPFAQSIMFGEPCSTVPVFKRPRKLKK